LQIDSCQSEVAKLVKHNPSLVKNNLIGLEREILRCQKSDYSISQSKHPAVLGSILTHPNITVDYSEAHIEFITNPHSTISKVLAELHDLHIWTAQQMERSEFLWHHSSPCLINSDDDIRIADFGTSNQGLFKSIYRRGLEQRYGKLMQSVAGVHFNFSLANTLIDALVQKHNLPVNQVKSQLYLCMARNVKRYYLMLMPLIGASPVVDSSFLRNRSHNLKKLTNDSYYAPNATSLRISDIGYQSILQEDLKISFNSLYEAVNATLDAILLSKKFDNLPLKNPQQQRIQLNQNQLQIENEHYSVVRVKPKPIADQLNLHTLLSNGISYVELRCIDIDPFSIAGISTEQCYLIEVFMLFCAMQTCQKLEDFEYQNLGELHQKVMYEGHSETALLPLWHRGEIKTVKIRDWSLFIFENYLVEVAEILDSANQTKEYSQSIHYYIAMLKRQEQTPAAKVLDLCVANGSFKEFVAKQSLQFHRQTDHTQIADATKSLYQKMATQSLLQQQQLENQTQIAIDQYIFNMYRQYEQIRAIPQIY